MAGLAVLEPERAGVGRMALWLLLVRALRPREVFMLIAQGSNEDETVNDAIN